MRLCPACREHIISADWRCSDCGFTAPVDDGIVMLQPDESHQHGGMPDNHAMLDQMQDGHFWFTSREAIIIDLTKRHLARPKRILDAGCGTGFMLRAFQKNFPEANLVGYEPYASALRLAARRLPRRVELVQGEIERLPFRDEFDLIGAFDVFEHIDHDDLAAVRVADALRPGGVLIATVPQHSWLWSKSDDFAGHRRRYSGPQFNNLLASAGLEILYSTSFVTLLLPLALASRLAERLQEGFDPSREFTISPLMNRILSLVMKIERAMIRTGASLPVGVSRLVVARRPEFARSQT